MRRNFRIKLLCGILTASMAFGNSISSFAVETVNDREEITIDSFAEEDEIVIQEDENNSEDVNENIEENIPANIVENISETDESSDEETVTASLDSIPESFVEYKVNPWYSSEYTEDDLRRYFEENFTEEELNPDESEYVSFDSTESIVSELKKILQDRKTSFSFTYSSFDVSSLVDKAMEDTDETDPLSGDYIKGNYHGYRASGFSYGGDYSITINFSWICYNDAEAEEKQVVAKAKKIVKELGLNNSSLSDYDKVKLIHDYLCETITYTNDGSLGCHGTYAALINGKCVCQGYANAFTKLTRMAGIASKYIVGGQICHAWNICKVRGGTDPERPWYNVDVTWDDPYGYTYFLKNNLEFDDHPRDDEYETSAYNKKHPMSLYSWGETKAGLDKDNPEFFFEGIDGSTLSTQVENNKPKILIYCTSGDLRNKNRSYISLKSLTSADFVKKGKVDIYAIDYGERYGNTRDDFLSLIDAVGSGKIKYAYYSDEVKDAINATAGTYWNSPTFVMIDENNRIQFIRKGRELTKDTIKNLYMYYLKDGWDPSADAKSVTVRKYTSAENLAENIFTTVGNNKTLSVKYGEEIYLKGVAHPNKEGIKDFVDTTTVEISDPDGAILYDKDSFLLQAVAKGTATVTFRSDYNEEVKATVKVSVVPAPIKSITLSKASLSLERGKSERLTVSFEPEKTTDPKVVTWSSSVPEVVSVVSDGDNAGIITALSSGSAVITAKCGKITATCRVSTVSPVTNVSIRSEDKKIYVGEKVSLSAAITPIDATIVRGIKWSVYNADLATITPNDRKDVCELTALKEGIIRVSIDVDGKKAEKEFTILPVSVTLNPMGGKLPEGSLSSITGKLGDELGTIPEPEYDGKIFTGWYTKKDSEGVRVSENTPLDRKLLDQTTVLYAGWKETVSEEITILPIADYNYTGSAIKPVPEVYFGDKKLLAGSDYSVSYKNNVNASDSAEVIVKGKGNYSDTAAATFKILPKDISDGDIIVDYSALTTTYNGKMQLLKPSVTFGKKSVKLGKDIEALYDDTAGGAYTNPGQYQITLKAKNSNYRGSRVVYQSIIRKDLLNIGKCSVSYVKSHNYTGEPVNPIVTVKEGKTVLNENEAYTVDYYKDVEIGTAYFVINGIGAYTGTKKFTYSIKGTGISKTTVTLDRSTFEYTGEPCEPKPTVLLKTTKELLLKDIDYTVDYSNNISPGTATIIISGKGKFTGSIKKTFSIKAADISRAVVKDEDGNENIKVAYEKGGAVPSVRVFLDGRELIKDKDYGIKSSGNNKLGNAAVLTVTGKGNYGKSKKVSFTVTEKKLQDNPKAYVLANDCVYSKTPGKWASAVSVFDSNGKKLTAGTDYEKEIVCQYVYDSVMTDGNHRSAGEILQKTDSPVPGTIIQATVTGKNCYLGSELKATYRIIDKAMNIGKGVTFKISDQYYTGKEIKIGKDDISFTAKGKDDFGADSFEIIEESFTSNITKGTAKLTLRGKAPYGGIKVVSFKIVPRKIVR